MYCIDCRRYSAKLLLVSYRLEGGEQLRRMEDKIRTLCAQLLAEQDEAKLTPLIVELRDQLRRRIERKLVVDEIRIAFDTVN